MSQALTKNVAGTDKLISRANKSLKGDHNHGLIEDLFEKLLSDKKNNPETLGDHYEKSLSDAYRNKEGIYYTPNDIVEDFFKYLPENKKELGFCDPCCGSGNFIIAALKDGFSPKNVYGFDIDAIAVKIANQRVSALIQAPFNNIKCTDFLTATANGGLDKFDVIFTNPPWGKKLDKCDRNEYVDKFNAGKSADTTALFLFASLTVLRKNGYLGFLVQDAFFNVATYEDARKKILSLDTKALLDFGKPFKGLITKAKSLIVKNRSLDGNYPIECKGVGYSYQRTSKSFLNNPKSILNMNCDPEAARILVHLYSLPNISLIGKAKWGLGIVTGNNKKFIREEPGKDLVPVYKGSDIKSDGILTPSCFIPSDLSLYQQVAPDSLYQAKEKLIYKFISSELVFFCDTKQRYLLNSANMLVLKNGFPITASQLCQLLNSRVINWLFKNTFDTFKILRSDIECIPIHTEYFNGFKSFEEATYINYLGLKDSTNGSFRFKR
jgi:site-specific DNA-methyltransferase (adenine-specific)